MRTVIPLALVALAGTACSHRVYSPPARMMPLASPAVAEGVVVGGSVSTQGALFGPDVVGASGQVRYGATETLETSAEVMVVHVEGDSVADTHPNIYGARVGVKWAPEPVSRFLALTGGVGGGASAGGGFVSPDLGLVVGWENRYVVPFVGFEASVSLPIDAQAVDTSEGDDDLGTHVSTPDRTWATRLTVGLRVPVTLGSGHGGSFYLAASSLRLSTRGEPDDGEDDDEGFGGLGGGFEFEF